MEQKITTEDKARIFCLHLGCPVEWGGDGYNQYLTGISRHGDSFRLQLSWNGDTQRYAATPMIDHCKLLLKPLSAISDEDAIEVGRMVGIWSASELQEMEPLEPDTIGVLRKTGVMFAESFGRKWGMVMSAPFSGGIDEILDSIDFLRSRGYALPYKGHDLFELGIAIPQPEK